MTAVRRYYPRAHVHAARATLCCVQLTVKLGLTGGLQTPYNQIQSNVFTSVSPYGVDDEHSSLWCVSTLQCVMCLRLLAALLWLTVRHAMRCHAGSTSLRTKSERWALVLWVLVCRSPRLVTPAMTPDGMTTPRVLSMESSTDYPIRTISLSCVHCCIAACLSALVALPDCRRAALRAPHSRLDSQSL